MPLRHRTPHQEDEHVAKSRAPRPNPSRTPAQKRPSGAAGSTGSRPSSATSSGPRAPQSKAGRQSVAAARNSGGSNRTQLMIGGVAIVVIVAVIIVGLVLNKKNTAVPADGYGDSKASIATVADGVITISAGTPQTSIDVFEDAMCPACGSFEHQFGQQMAQLADEGKLGVRLHMLNFLNRASSSGDYSTRGAAALLAVATEAGSQPGLFLKFHTALFAEGTQPKENSGSDLSNAQLGEVAKTAGVPDAVVASIAAGKYVEAAAANAKTSQTAIQAAVGEQWATPTVLHDNKPLALNSPDWLTTLTA
ncbi:thioredoxin domain-containing protein [Nakamurella sp. A5-74]|uniref:Thioredoxin domain-containing protein n=1 Tax=Nakamurella sp. A5-74 TaxID=3158264 RepID=A0AAU8DUN2_9ACTN